MTEIPSPPPEIDPPYVDPDEAQADEGDAESPKNDEVPIEDPEAEEKP